MTLTGVDILIKRYKVILGYTGTIIMGIGFALLTPLITIFFFQYSFREVFSFLITATITILIGLKLRRFTSKQENITISIQEGGIIVLFSWIGTIFISALPFLIAGELNFIQSVFEVVSGYTTTGLSVVNVSVISPMFLLWRSIMQLLGGVGLIVIMLSAIIGPHGVGLYNDEAS